MKKIFALLLAFTITSGICSCNGKNSTTNSNQTNWKIQQTVDEFGDVTEDSATVISGTFSGKFSNTATSNGELTVNLEFVKKEPFEHYMAKFDLKEYNDANATYTSNDSLILKTKVNDEIAEYPLTGNAPHDSLYLGFDDYYWDGDLLFNALYSGNDVRCIINIGHSEYSFTLNSSNFSDICKKSNFSTVSADLTARETVNIILEDKGRYQTIAHDWMRENYDKFQLMNSEQMAEILNGYFIQIIPGGEGTNNGYWFPQWYIHNYRDKTAKIVSTYIYSASEHEVLSAINQGQFVSGFNKYRSHKDTPDAILRELSFENDILTETLTTDNSKRIYELRKITDNIFLMTKETDNGQFKYAGLLIRSNGYDKDSIVKAVTSAIENDIPKIKD